MNGVDPWGLSAAGDVTGIILTGLQHAAEKAGWGAATPVGWAGTILVTLADGTQTAGDPFLCTLLTTNINGDEKDCFYDCGKAGWTVMTISKCDSCPDNQIFTNATIDSGLLTNSIILIGNPIK